MIGSNTELDELYREIYVSMVNIFGSAIDKVVLYGSFARGDYDEESDIDIAIIARGTDMELQRHHHEMVRESSRFMREYDRLVSLHEIPADRYNKYKNVYPYYRNIETEGVLLNA